MTRDPEREKDWARQDWAGSVSDEPPIEDTQADQWNKTAWVGDQGEGAPLPVPPASMPEGEASISGNRHPVGEQHWAGGSEVRERTDLPLETASDRDLAGSRDRAPGQTPPRPDHG